MTQLPEELARIGATYQAYLCKGIRTDISGREKNVVMVKLNEDGTLGDELWYPAKKTKLRFDSPGHVYLIPVKDGKWWPGLMIFDHLWEDKTERAVWVAEDGAAKAVLQAIALEEKFEPREDLRELLFPLMEIYSNTNELGRRGLEVYLLNELRAYYREVNNARRKQAKKGK